ncbi:DUF4153 domain-containing protein [Sphingomonas sp. LT1P40]|uniref:DUF4153 domain-containing protein n=1 Tax=Alteristakelama amylovorans TaxID=3096166 RepID=UPI002FCB3D5F
MTDEQNADRWPLLPVILAALGLATGVAAHAILGSGYQPALSAIRVALLSLVTVSAILFAFIATRGDLLRSALVAGGCGIIAALILYFNGATSGWSATEGWRLFSLALAIGIAAPLFQAGREGGFRPLNYAAVHDFAWTNVVIWCLSWAFVGIVMLLSWLLAALFDLIGIEFLGRMLQKDWVWRPLVGLAFGLGVALLREHVRIVRLLQNVAMLVLGVLAPVLAIGLALFLLALPFTGLQPLWDATKATTPILLSCAAGALLLVNAVIGNGGDDPKRNRVLRWAAMVLAVVMLPLTVIAQIATALRINQYGFTPERLWALTFVILATAYATAYLVSVVRGQAGWAERVRPANLNLAFITCGVALLLATPILSFNAISTRDQVARLESGKLSPDKFDWRALAFHFGEPGRKALERLKTASNPAIRAKALAATTAKSSYDVSDGSNAVQAEKLDKTLRILPAGTPLPVDLRELVAAGYQCRREPCTLAFLDAGKTAILLTNACFAPPKPAPTPTSSGPVVTTMATPGCYGNEPDRYVLTDGKWLAAERVRQPDITPAERANSAAGLTDGNVEIRPVERRQVFVGGVPVGQPFE